MTDETPRLNLNKFEQGDTDWDHSDTVDAVDEQAIERAPISERPESGEYDDELFHATDQRITWRWDAVEEDWKYFSGPGSEETPTPGTVHRESVHTENLNTIQLSSEYLEGDGSTDDATGFREMIEAVDAAGGGLVILDQPTDKYLIDTNIKPNTSGNRVVLFGVGQPEIHAPERSNDYPLNFEDASSVTLHNIEFSGTTSSGAWGVIGCGDDMFLSQLHFSSGQGGIAGNGAQTVYGDNLTFQNMRETSNGTASCIILANDSADIHFTRVVMEDSDRGWEIEDNVKDVTVRGTWVENIDNSQAETPGASYSLMVRTHGNAGEYCENVLIDWAVVKDCKNQVNILDPDPGGQVNDIEMRNIYALDNGGDFRADGEATLKNVVMEWDAVTPPAIALNIRRGNKTVKGFENIGAPSDRVVRINDVDRFRLEDLVLDGDGAGSGIEFGGDAAVRRGTIENLDFTNNPTNAVNIASDAIDIGGEDGYGLVIKDSYLDGFRAIRETGLNDPIRTEGCAYAGHLDDTTGIVAIEGWGSNDGDPSVGGVWNGNGFEGASVIDTTNNVKYVYRNGAWV